LEQLAPKFHFIGARAGKKCIESGKKCIDSV